jgi:hypothetical protein
MTYLRRGDDYDLIATYGVVKAVGPSGVAGRPLLLDQQEHGISITIEARFNEALDMARGFALAPQTLSRPRPVTNLTTRQRLIQRGAIHPCQHHDLAAIMLLSDSRNQSLIIPRNVLKNIAKRLPPP